MAYKKKKVEGELMSSSSNKSHYTEASVDLNNHQKLTKEQNNRLLNNSTAVPNRKVKTPY